MLALKRINTVPYLTEKEKNKLKVEKQENALGSIPFLYVYSLWKYSSSLGT